MQINDRSFDPGSEQRIPVVKERGRILKQIPARQGSRVRLQTISRKDGRAAVAQIYNYSSIA